MVGRLESYGHIPPMIVCHRLRKIAHQSSCLNQIPSNVRELQRMVSVRPFRKSPLLQKLKDVKKSFHLSSIENQRTFSFPAGRPAVEDPWMETDSSHISRPPPRVLYHHLSTPEVSHWLHATGGVWLFILAQCLHNRQPRKFCKGVLHWRDIEQWLSLLAYNAWFSL